MRQSLQESLQGIMQRGSHCSLNLALLASWRFRGLSISFKYES